MLNSTRTQLFLSLLALVPFVALCYFIFPAGDDFSYAYKALNTPSFLKRQVVEWFHWNGRYSSNFLVLGNPLYFGSLTLYQLLPLVLLGISMLSHYYLANLLFKTKLNCFWFTLTINLIYLGLMPDLSEGIYWYTSSVSYFLSCALTPFLIRLIIEQYFYNKRRIVAIIPLLIVVNGLNETIMLFLLLAAIIALLLLPKNKSNLLPVFVQLSCFALVYFSPGNEVRSSYFSNNHDIANTLSYGILHSFRFTGYFALAPVTIVFALLVRQKTNLRIKRLKNNWWLLILFGLQFIACASPIWNTGILGQHRTVNLAIYFQILTILLFFLQEKILLPFSLASKLKLHKHKHLGLLWLSIFLLPNVVIATFDLTSGSALNFRKQNEERISWLIDAKQIIKAGTYKIPAYSKPPRSIFVYDITCDKKHWKNEVYTKYYGLYESNISIVPEDCFNEEESN